MTGRSLLLQHCVYISVVKLSAEGMAAVVQINKLQAWQASRVTQHLKQGCSSW